MNLLLRLRCLGSLGLAVMFCGCAGYHLGPTGGQVAGERSIQINPVQNSTIEPGIGPVVSHALRKQIQSDGTLRLETSGSGARVILYTEVVRYKRAEIAFQPADTLTATDYTLHLTARVVARDRVTGKDLLNREVSARYTLLVGGDLASAERQALPALAEDLARNITTLLVEGDW